MESQGKTESLSPSLVPLVAEEGVNLAVGSDDADVPAVGNVHRLVDGNCQAL